MLRLRSRLRRWHVLLGWVVGLPIFLWLLTGLVMAARPIEEVRGSHLLRAAAPLPKDLPLVLPRTSGLYLETLSLEQRADGPRWILRSADGTVRSADAATGRAMAPLTAAQAVRELQARYAGTAKVVGTSLTDPKKPPLDLRRPVAAWRVEMDDGALFYVDSNSGAVVATRTRWWRFYDLMWGLHIMDLKTREDAHNPLLIGFAVLGLAMALLALVLLPLTRKG